MKKYLHLIVFFVFISIVAFLFFLPKKVWAQNECNTFVSSASFCSPDCPAEAVTPSQSNGFLPYYCKGVGSSSQKGTVYNPVLNPNVGSGVGESIIAKFIAALINLFFIAGSLAVLVFFVLGGLAWITSEGDKGKMEIARNRLTYAVSGIAIIAASYAVLYILGKFLGIPFFDKLKIIWPTVT